MNSIRKNFIYNVVYQMLLIVLPLITTPYISRVLGSDGLGIYAYTYTVANYFMLAAMLGVKNYGNRSIAAVRDEPDRMSRTFWEIYGLQFFCSAAALLLYLAYVLCFCRTYRTIALIQGLYVFSGMLDISWLFFGLEKFKVTVSRNIAIRLLDLACIFLFVRTREDLWKYTLIMVLGIVFSQGYLWGYLRNLTGWQRPSLSGILRHLKPELILFVPIIAVSLYTMMDKIMLGQMSTITQVGFYEGSEKIRNIPMGVITALGTVMLPRMSNLAARGKKEESGRYIRSSMTFAVFLASGMTFGIAGIAEDFVPVFLGGGYEPCIVLIQVMAPSILFISWANVIRTQYLIPNRRDRSYVISVSLGAAVNFAVNVIMIPVLGALGAVIGTVCAEAAVCISQTLMVRRDLPVLQYLKDTAPCLAFGVLMLPVIRGVSGLAGSAGAGLVCGMLSGGGAYVLLSGIYFAAFHRDMCRELLQRGKDKRGKEK